MAAARAAAILKGDRTVSVAPPPPAKRARRAPAQKPIDATPERISMAEPDGKNGVRFHDTVEAMIDKAGQRALITRRFADAQIDRWLKQKRLTYAQWYAADWYRNQYALAGIEGRVVAQYDITHPGAEGSSYGLPANERQLRARQRWRQGRALLPENMVDLVDRLVIHDVAPALSSGRMRDRYAARIGRALDPLADWLSAPASA
ncbi:hypothetical protein [Sphingomonas sp. MM-1]|uniref:hypothetical protein n=1 Tax=Sphingomonas sp. MM-1 TaxID=745310 RepID=UPI0005A49907|nr:MULTISPECIES: hypothetical protein [unclassified Sphingomonas]MDX3884045.1 hypothetical protein [Sphingomonas sp.]